MKVYHIPGSLTQQKGAINYKGSIRVDGNISGRISIKAGGNIVVGGGVEGASLDAEGEIVIHSGVSGGENRLESRCSITLGGEVEGVDIRCYGDLNLTHRLNRCTIRTQGRVNGKTALLRDCHVNALSGLLVQNVECGCPGACIIKVGVNYMTLEEISNLDGSLERKRFELQHLLNNLGPMIKRALHDREYGRRMGQDIDTEMGRARTFKEEAAQLERERLTLAKKGTQNGIACISVVRSLQKGTQLKAERAFLLATENINGPISFVPDKSGATFITEKGLLLEMLTN
jgi:uncharacterized protein (DUF342 family)